MNGRTFPDLYSKDPVDKFSEIMRRDTSDQMKFENDQFQPNILYPVHYFSENLRSGQRFSVFIVDHG